MATLRVRQIIEGMNPQQRQELKKQLPPKLKVPAYETQRYPSALLGMFPVDPYANLGRLAEALLRLSSNQITFENLLKELVLLVPALSDTNKTKLQKSKTTQPFLDALVTTRQELEKVLRPADGDLTFEECITAGRVEGHPDIKNRTQIFEVKLTGMLKANWVSFLLQVFAYGSIVAETTDLYLVLPLQKAVWHADIRAWKQRQTFLKTLQSWSETTQTTTFPQMMMGRLLASTYRVGSHVSKTKTIKDTILSLPSADYPYQIFLGGNQTSVMNVKDDDLASALSLVESGAYRIFVHAQYLINMCVKAEDDWAVKLLGKNLQYARSFGAKGVVVHVGKSVKQEKAAALEIMRQSIVRTLEFASPECPLLLETPAGQGTELLTEPAEFLDFVESFKDPRLAICVDTCHVFAAGTCPLVYMEKCLGRPTPVRLVHFNDSQDTCGACHDRHAFIGTGKIGLETMEKVAKLCQSKQIPMLVE